MNVDDVVMQAFETGLSVVDVTRWCSQQMGREIPKTAVMKVVDKMCLEGLAYMTIDEEHYTAQAFDAFHFPRLIQDATTRGAEQITADAQANADRITTAARADAQRIAGEAQAQAQRITRTRVCAVMSRLSARGWRHRLRRSASRGRAGQADTGAYAPARHQHPEPGGTGAALDQAGGRAATCQGRCAAARR